MANTTIDSNGTLVHLVATTTTTTTKANCVTAIAAGFAIGKVTAEISLGGELATQEHKYLNADTEYAMGTISYGTFSIDSPFSKSDNAGQEKLKDSAANKTRYKMILSNTDDTYTVVPIFVKSANKVYPLEDFVMYKTTIQQNGAAVEVTA